MVEKLFLCYPKCNTCQKAARWLKENGIEVNARDISKDNPTRRELARWIEKSGLPITKFFNTSGKKYKENNLKEKIRSASEAELVEILSSDGMLVKRPIMITDDFVLVGFNEDDWREKLKS